MKIDSFFFVLFCRAILFIIKTTNVFIFFDRNQKHTHIYKHNRNTKTQIKIQFKILLFSFLLACSFSSCVVLSPPNPAGKILRKFCWKWWVNAYDFKGWILRAKTKHRKKRNCFDEFRKTGWINFFLVFIRSLLLVSWFARDRRRRRTIYTYNIFSKYIAHSLNWYCVLYFFFLFFFSRTFEIIFCLLQS